MTTLAPAPAPAAAAPPPLSPTGRSAIRAVLVIAAALLVVGCVVTLGVAAWGINSVRISTAGSDLPSGTRSLTIVASDATVHVRSDPQTTAPRVELRTVNSARGRQQRLDVTSDAAGTRIVVTPGSREFMDFARSGDVTVTLPSTLASALSLTTQQDDGNVIVDADLDRLVARSTDGNLVLDGGARVVDITAGDGNVVARRPISVTESFVAESADGNVEVEFAGSAPRTIEATTRDGDVAITLPQVGPYLVRTQSGDSTSVQVPETNDPARAVSVLTVRSDDGNVEISTHGRGR